MSGSLNLSEASHVATMTPDERFVEALYNQAVVNVYEAWTRGVSWVSRAEVARATRVVSAARRNLAILGEMHEGAEPSRVVRWNWDRAA
ncbi:hypothetical protein GCM10022254_32700 [Actinomadura meridiana]|uniref:Uncharacterized protein n=1 Tax=Actinomadura meridiana TaxID=559626 RepID=A0ABP8C2I2_9ACTN